MTTINTAEPTAADLEYMASEEAFLYEVGSSNPSIETPEQIRATLARGGYEVLGKADGQYTVVRCGDSVEQIACADYEDCVTAAASDYCWTHADGYQPGYECADKHLRELPPGFVLSLMMPTAMRPAVVAAMRRQGIADDVVTAYKFLPSVERLSITRAALADATGSSQFAFFDGHDVQTYSGERYEMSVIAALAQRMRGLLLGTGSRVCAYEYAQRD